MSVNPYASPKSSINQQLPDFTGYRLATQQQRIFTFLLDLAFCYVLLQMLLVILFLYQVNILSFLHYSIIQFLLALFVYYFFQEVIWHVTLAKLVMRTQVVSDSGHVPGAGQILLRTICRFVPFEFISFLPSLSTVFGKPQKTPIGWHDKFSNTRVIDVRTI